MKPIFTKYPKYCNINTGVCVIPVEIFDPIEIMEISGNYEFV